MEQSVIVIGGGASGMTAAIYAARAGAAVTILEHTDRIGKKILSTGNGRCNMTNLHQSVHCYRSSQPDFPMAVLKQFSTEQTLDFFKELGILTKSKDGYLYPNSEQASAVLDVLCMEIGHLGIEVVCGCHIQSVKKLKGGQGFQLHTSLGNFQAACVVLAAGSKAAPVTGSDGSGYELAKQLGHSIIPPLPALVQLRCKENHYKQLAGIRTEVKLSLLADQRVAASETGELQLTDYGISGIPTFQISRYASEALSQKKTVVAEIDFLPHQSFKETEEFFRDRARHMGHKTCEEWMVGILNKKLSVVLLKLAGISRDQPVSGMDSEKWQTLLKQIKEYKTVITATNSFEQAQVCCGGVDTREIEPDTMESRQVRGLYLAGELLDVDGICGGYNLQWAWSSGAVAGTYAGGKQIEKEGTYDSN